MNARLLPIPRRHRAFTLSELLIVVGLLLVLLALLFPALSGLREREKSVICTQQLKQIGAAAAAFAADNQNAVVPYALNQPEVIGKYGNAFWYAIIYYYLSPEAPWVSYNATILDPRAKPFFCPASGSLYAINRTCGWANVSPPSSSPWKHYLRMGQGLTEKAHKKADGSGWNTAWRPYPLPGSLHETAYFADGTAAFTPESITLKFPHGKQCNVLYMDGHVAPISNPDFTNNPDLLEEREWIHFFGRRPY